MKYYSKGESYYIIGEYKKAYNEFKSSIEIGEGSIFDSINYMGCCQIALGNYQEAIELFDRIIESNSTWERPFFNKGRAYLKLKNYSEALAQLNRAMMINPNNEDVYFYLGKYYEERKEYEEAKSYYEKSIEINSDQPETHLNLGIVYFHLGIFERAIQEFDLSCEDESIMSDALSNKGLVLCKLKEYDRAIEVYLKANKIAPNDIDMMYCISSTYSKLRDFTKALEWSEKILIIDAKHKSAKRLRHSIIKRIRECL